MPFIKTIQQFSSLSIVGMAKNTGKTTCLNYVVGRLQEEGQRVALTSIGVDGEERDVLYDTPKPRIMLHDGMVFVTSESDFDRCEVLADVLSISERSTALGRLITARARGFGKVVLSGPSDSAWLQKVVSTLPNYGTTMTLVDGALSRMSLASPAVTDAMILCTGAACSPQMNELIRRTKFRCSLIDLEQVTNDLQPVLQSIKVGVWKKNEQNNEWISVGSSVFTLDDTFEKNIKNIRAVFVSGALTEPFLKRLNSVKNNGVQLIVNDFTKLFITPFSYEILIRNGGSIRVLQKAKLVAVCTNPTSPEGARMDPIVLQERMQEALKIPVYDVMRCV